MHRIMLVFGVRSLLLTLCLLLWHAAQIRASSSSGWTNPNAQLPAFSSTYTVGDRIILSWQSLNKSQDDLWLTRYDLETDQFSLRIASQIDISVAGSYAWTIANQESEIKKDTRFELRFIPTGSNYDPNSQAQIASPAFNLVMVNQDTSPNGTIGAASSTLSPTATSSDISRSSTSATSSNFASVVSTSAAGDNSGLSNGVIAGIVVAILAVVGASGFAIGYLWFKKRSANKYVKTVACDEVNKQGPFEILGDYRRPLELTSKEAQVYEMNASRETHVNDADSSIANEKTTEIRRPGIHEMAG